MMTAIMERYYALIATTFASFALLCFADTGRVKQLGNRIEASTSGVDSAGSVFLLDGVVLDRGVLFAYTAFFRSDKPVRFQVWRPVANQRADGGHVHRLVGETRVIPAVHYARETVYIESKLTERCMRVEKHDRLGVYMEEAPGAIAYTFDRYHPTALSNTIHNLSRPHLVNGLANFDSLTFPYDFSLAAHIDIAPLNDTDMDGDFAPCPRGLLVPDMEDVTLPPTSPTPPVTGRPGAVGATGPPGGVGPAGPQGVQGVVGATGEQGIAGVDGGDGVAGIVGAAGVPGSAGADGAEGATGQMGPAGPRGETPSVDHPRTLESSDSVFADPQFVMYLLIWLIILTVVVIIFITISLVLRRRRRPQPSTRYIDRVPSQLYPDDKPHSWTDTMREETETNYSNDSLSTRQTTDNAPDPTADNMYHTALEPPAYVNLGLTDDTFPSPAPSETELKNY